MQAWAAAQAAGSEGAEASEPPLHICDSLLFAAANGGFGFVAPTPGDLSTGPASLRALL